MAKSRNVGVAICAGLTILIGLAMAITCLVIRVAVIDDKIKQEAAQATQLTDSNYNKWGLVPGELGVLITREFVFYNFTNPMGVMFNNEKPNLTELGPYSNQYLKKKQKKQIIFYLAYQEYQNFTQPIYSEDNSKVNFGYWEYFTQLDKKDHNDLISFTNYPALGAWYQMQHLGVDSLALQALSTVIFDMEYYLLPTIQATLYRNLILRDYDSARADILSNLTENQAQMIWNDTYFGIQNETSFTLWVETIRDNTKASFFQDYFYLSNTDIASIQDYIVYSVNLIEEGLIDESFCSQNNNLCTDQYVTAFQWAQAGITKNDLVMQPSVVIGNNTEIGTYPELSYFYEEYFLVKIEPTDPNYKGLVFSTDWAEQVLSHVQNFDKNNPQWLKDPYVLLNIGNIRVLLQAGQSYDTSKDDTYLVVIQNRFLLNDIYSARVLYEYIKYLGTEFAQTISQGGNSGYASMGSVMSQALYQEFMSFQEQFLYRILALTILDFGITCQQSVQNVIGITQAQIDVFCNVVNPWTYESVSKLTKMCNVQQQGDYWQYLLTQTKLTDAQLQSFCNPNTVGFGSSLYTQNQFLKFVYGCTQWANRCSAYEFALKQWYSSLVSLNPPIDSLNQTYTAWDWFPDIYHTAPIEYLYFTNQYRQAIGTPFRELTLNDANYLLSFDCLFNGQMVQRALLYQLNNQNQQFTSWFIFNEFNQLIPYLRYIMVEVGLGGFAQTKSVKEILFGYEDLFIKELATQNPARGGDPSIDYVFGVNMNKTVQQVISQGMFTGIGNQNYVRRYSQIFGQQTIKIPVEYFDGNETKYTLVNPWSIDVPVNTSTDALCFQSDLQSSEDIGILILDIARTANMKYNYTTKKFGFDLYRYDVDPEFIKKNADFQSYKYDGVVNQTKLQHAPIFQSFPHFYLGDQSLSDSVLIYDQKGNIQTKNQWDASYVVVEPITGISVEAVLKIQLNIELQQDQLFNTSQYAMMPIFTVTRAANITQEQVDNNFSSLNTALKWKRWILWTLMSVGIILIVIGVVVLYYGYIKIKDQIYDEMA